MARGNAIAAAVLASAGNPGSSGSGPSAAGGLSPLVASYQQQYSVNRPYSPLPRPASVFLDGAFAPLAPITAMPIDPPREDTGRPDPRRHVYRPGYNLPAGVPGEQDKLVPFAVLRDVADRYSVARSCVDKRKAEIIGLEWDIVPTDEAERAMVDDDKARADFEKRRAITKEFFEHPDADRAKYPTFGAWLGAILEDRFVLDAVAIHLVPPRKRGAGPFGSDLAALSVLDGSTVRPLLSTLAETPRPPAVAFEQYFYGVPRVDLISVINGDDAAELGEPAASFRADQLIYMRESARAFTPFGYSAVEKAILPIRIGLNRQRLQEEYFEAGTVPGMFVVPGPDISTPQQIRQLMDSLNAMAGDLGAKHRIIVLPPGSKTDPQKHPPLADQTDEWIVSQVAMPFGLTPMDLGVTPRVSAVQTPSESRELSQINSDKGSQTRVEPVCADLKSQVFDFVIQQLFKQKDMQFSWGLKDRGKNRQAIIDQGVALVQVGGKTVDEFRIDLGEAPYGLPETSVPLVYTATGPVPLSAVATEEPQPGSLPAGQQGQQAALPPGQAQPGQQRKPTDDELTTPAHEAAEKLPDTKTSGSPAAKPATGGSAPAKDSPDRAAQAAKKARQDAELEYLARHLRKGRAVEAFRADHLPAKALEAAKRARPEGVRAAVAAAKSATEAKRRQDRREAAIAAAVALVTARLQGLLASHKGDKLSMAHVIDQAVTVMAGGYAAAIAAGSRDASDDYEDTPETDPGEMSKQAGEQADGQRGYFLGLLQDVTAGMSDAATTSRLGLYGATLRRSYNESYGTTALVAHPDYLIKWELGANEHHCKACIARDGKTFTLDSLPGWPGDGGFGGPGALGQQNICAGGPNCHCSVSLIQGGQVLATGTNTQSAWAKDYYQQQNETITAARQQAAAARQDFTDSLPSGPAIRAQTRDQLRQQVADLANERIRAAGGYQGVSVYPQDVPATIIAQMLPPGMEGAAGLSSPRVNVEQAVEMMFAKASATLDMTKAEFAAIVKGVIADLAAAGISAPPVDPEVVRDQLAVNYRPEGITWVSGLSWAGPAPIPLDRIDWDHLGAWAASHQDGRVAHFKADIEAGKLPRPVVMVQVPGSPTLKVIDGHHRSLAYRELGKPVPAYVGLAGSDSATAPWFMTHSYQLHSGVDPMNKALGDEDPSRVAFILFRAPNENGKPRFLLQKRADDGSWGLPGGRCRDGEVPWDAAVREAREELGKLPALKPLAAWSRAEDDHVVWTYLVDLPAMFSPDGSGSTAGETAGWGWFKRRDTEALDLHPAMRRTWESLDFGDPLLGGKPVTLPAANDPYAGLAVPQDAGGMLTRKEARGYELNARSGMISLDVPEGLIEPVPGGVSDAHLTVVYLGPDVDNSAFAEACRRAAEAAALVPGPLAGTISGRGTFEPSEGSDGKTVVWAEVTLPGAETLRSALEDLSASEHRTWVKHVTRAYIDEGDPVPDALPPVPVTFTHLSVHRGDDVARFTLGGNDAPGEPHDGDESTCPCGTPVVYDWANGWQHADGSVSHDDGESVSDKMGS